MAQIVYPRVDIERLDAHPAHAAPVESAAASRVRWLVLPLSLVLCVTQSVLTVVASNVHGIIITSTMIPVLAFAVLFLIVLGGNPLLRAGRGRSLAFAVAAALVPTVLWRLSTTALASRLEPATWSGLVLIAGVVAAAVVLMALLRQAGLRPFNRRELTCLFTAMMATSGIATFGLTEQLIPLIAAPYNAEWNTPQRGWSDTVLLKMRPELYITDKETIQLFREGVKPLTGEPGWGDTLHHWREVFLAVPWRAWAGPLAYWMIFVAGCYAAFYSLTYVVLGYWSDREKLIFPLAKLPQALLPDEGAESVLPAMLRSPGFWAGFALSFLVLGWNGAVEAKWLDPNLGTIPLGMGSWPVYLMLTNTPFEGLALGPSGLMFLILFTAIGISFLLPLEISFSVWLYFLVGKLVILIHVWLGYETNGNDFPTNWLWLNNPVTAQGGGGLFFFSVVSLFRCLRDYARLVAGRGWGEKLRIGMPVVGLVISLTVVTLWMSWNMIGLWWALAFVLVLTLLTVGLMRIVAEGGIYWFQAHTSFFHIYKMLGLGRLLSPALVGPLVPIYSVLFLDIKTFLAPNLLNAASMQKSVGGGRFKFHLNIFLCLVASVVVSLGMAIFLAHLRGAQQMQGWFYSSAPLSLMDIARDATRSPSAFNGVTTAWWIGGACWVALSMYLRTTLFWFPHPIGYIMLINPLMAQLWFSFFIGWVCKKITVKYGGKATFDKVRGVFIGLILGEFMALVFWVVLSIVFRITVAGISLNRYS